MRSLFYFLYKFRAFFVFLLLELICISFFIRRESFTGSVFFQRTGDLKGTVALFTDNTREYFGLRSANDRLASENAELRSRIEGLKYLRRKFSADLTDTVTGRYEVIPAAVIDNSLQGLGGYITVDKGTKDEVIPGMGVVSSEGIVGKVISCTRHFSLIRSITHRKVMTSVQLYPEGYTGTVKRRTNDVRYASLMYIPKHISVRKGDTVVTSGANAVFPEDVLVGIIDSISVDPGTTYHDIRLKTSTNFARLKQVYIVKDILKPEYDKLASGAQE